MNTIQELLKHDVGDLETPKKTVTLSLAKLGNAKFDFPIVALRPAVVAEIQEGLFQLTMRKKDVEIKQTLFDGKLRTLTEGCPEIFKNKELQDNFKAKSPHDLIQILLTPGEIDFLKDEIDEISGFEEEEEKIEDIKN